MAKKSKKLPRRIAGYKVPKQIRKNSKPLLKLLDTPQFKALLGTIMASAAAAFADQLTGDGKRSLSKKKAKRRMKFMAAEGKDRVTEMAESVGRAIASAIGSHLPAKAKSQLASPTAR